MIDTKTAIVSSDSEQLILVDELDNPIGYRSKCDCHAGEGVLHRAFSIFVFNPDGKLLIQRRSAEKRLWPLYWSNTCCSHPRRGEGMLEAVARRLDEELGLTADVRFLYKFVYHAAFRDIGSEHESCWVYAGVSNDGIVANPHEIAAWRYVSPPALDAEIADNPEYFTPWMKMEWIKVRERPLAQLLEP